MKTRSLFKKVVMVAALGTLTGLSYAATNPANPTAASSTGDLTINATVSALFQISSLTDITFAAYSGSGVWTASDSFCVYTNGAAGVYSVTATGSNAGGCAAGFNLCRAGIAIPYTVDYTDATPTTTTVTSGTPLASQQGHATLANCGGTNASVAINIAALDAQAAPASGTAYTGLLTFLVAP